MYLAENISIGMCHGVLLGKHFHTHNTHEDMTKELGATCIPSISSSQSLVIKNFATK